MTNPYYNSGSFPSTGSPATSASMRAELALIAAGFDKLPTMTGNANKLISVNEAGTALVANDDITQIDFDTAGGGDAVARLVWNDTDGTLNLGLKGGNVVLQVGQETVLRAYNNTGSAMTDGQVVYINASSGQRPTIALAQANAEATSTKVLGVVTEPISNNAEGFVSTDGLVRRLNTLTLTEGAVVWLSDSVAGGLTTTKPTAPNHAVMIGYCVKSHGTQGILYVKVQNGYELDELHDVLISGLAANNMLRYDGSLWRNIAGPAGDVVGSTDSQTLTNKTVALGSNTVSGTIAQFNTALTDADFATLAGTETLTNKTISGASNTLTNIGNGSLTNSSVTIGSTSVSLGGTATSVAGLTLTSPTVSGPTTLSANSTSDALRITQTGTGNALVVEDETSPDSTPFAVAADGKVLVGITTTQPTGLAFPLQVSSVGISGIGIGRWDNTGGASDLALAKSRSGTNGTLGAALVNTDTIGRVLFVADNGSSMLAAARIQAVVNGTPGTQTPADIVFQTATSSVGPVEAVRVLSGGGFQISRTAVTAPDASDGNVFSGTYTPTLTNVSNIDISTARTCQYMRVGDVVTVSGRVTVDAQTSGANWSLRMSLPVASTFTTAEQGAGSFRSGAVGHSNAGVIYASSSGGMSFNIIAETTAANEYYFHFTYRVV